MTDGNKNYIRKLDCFGDAAMLVTRWTHWLTAFELYAGEKGLITRRDAVDHKQCWRASLLHFGGPDIQDIFSTLPDTGTATDYNKAVKVLNKYFVLKVNTAYVCHAFPQ